MRYILNDTPRTLIAHSGNKVTKKTRKGGEEKERGRGKNFSSAEIARLCRSWVAISEVSEANGCCLPHRRILLLDRINLLRSSGIESRRILMVTQKKMTKGECLSILIRFHVSQLPLQRLTRGEVGCCQPRLPKIRGRLPTRESKN